MIRSIALAAILGALVAAGVLYPTSEPDWRTAIAIWLGASEPAPAASASIAGQARVAAEHEPRVLSCNIEFRSPDAFRPQSGDAPDWTREHVWLEFVARVSIE